MDADKASSGPYDDEAFSDGVDALVNQAIMNQVDTNELVASLEKAARRLRDAIADSAKEAPHA